MAIIAKYKFNPSLYANYLPNFNREFTGYTVEDTNNSDGTITRTISHDTLKPAYVGFGTSGGVSDRERSLLEVIECDTSQVTDMNRMFQNCQNLTLLNLSNFDTSKVTNMFGMFSGCKKLTSLDLSNFDTSKVTNMNGMFYEYPSTLLDLSSFNTSNVTDMNGMFQSCKSLTSLNLSSFDTSKVTTMYGMFRDCQSLTSLDLSSFDTSKVTTMYGMFRDCQKLTSLDLSSFNTSNVTDMSAMFYNCLSLTSLGLSNFNTNSVTNMSYMFIYCRKLTSLDLSNFNTSSVNNMDSMFSGCTSLTSINLSSFNTSKVTDMAYTFQSCSSLTSLDLSSFNTSNVTNMGGMFNNCLVSDIGLLYATSSTINSLLAQLGASVARNIYYTDAPLDELTVQDNITYKKYELTMATFPYTLNKLPNGVADYIDVVNKVHVQRVGRVTFNGTETERTWIKGEMHSNNPQKDNLSRFYYGGGSGYNDLKTSSSMLSDKLPYANVTADRSEIESVGHMGNAYFNIIIRKDRLVTDDADGFKTWLQSNPITILHELATPIYTPLTEEEIAQLPLSAYEDGYINLSSDQLMPSFEFRMRASNRYQVDMLETGYYYLNAPVGNVRLGTANVDVQQMPCIVKVDNVGTGDGGYRLGFSGEVTDTTQITLAKLPSHRIPTSFTQGMKCGTDFGYWEGIKSATGKQLYVNETNKLDFAPIELNRIEYGNTIVEDEFDIATGKLTKRVGIMALDGSENWKQINDVNTRDDEYVYTYQMKFADMVKPNFKPAKGVISNRHPYQPSIWEFDKEGFSIGGSDVVLALHKEKAYSLEALKQYLATNPLIIYYELEVPEISYVDLPLNTLRALDATTTLQVANQSLTNYLLPQVKPSHLTYPVPSLVGNRTYTVVHNRKNIAGSTKPIELNLGGTVVQLNDASSKTLVTTPSTLAHSNLIFIGGESTVDHIMVLDGDWTNKPIDYFENMKGHDTDAIITIMGDGKIDDVAEQYLW